MLNEKRYLPVCWCNRSRQFYVAYINNSYHKVFCNISTKNKLKDIHFVEN